MGGWCCGTLKNELWIFWDGFGDGGGDFGVEGANKCHSISKELNERLIHGNIGR